MPHQYDPQADRVVFYRIPQAVRDSITFLAEHKPSTESDVVWIAADDIRVAKPEAVPVHFIFHSAFCRSTLLVKALNALGGLAGQSEPMILNGLQAAAGNPRTTDLVKPLMQLLGRPTEDEQAVIAKPSNFANGVIPSLLDHASGTKAILLYGNLRDFLRSVAKKGLQGRIWGRRQLRFNQQTIPLDLGMDALAMFELTDMQAAGLAWLLHIRQFAVLTAERGSQVKTLEANAFNDAKAETIAAAATFFGASASDAECQAIAKGPIFASHAKLGGDFDAIISEQNKAASSKIVDEEIEQVAQWVEAIMQQLRITLPLGQPLSK